MANERDNPDAKKDQPSEQDKDSGRKRVIGKGMTSPDSTQVPLRSDTGEPDWDAIKGTVPADKHKGQPKRPS
jgi:hypothetical protein